MGIAEIELGLLRATTDAKIMVESLTRAAKHLVLPIIGSRVGIEVRVLPIAEKLGEFLLVISQQSIFSLPSHIIHWVKSVQGLGHLLPTIISVIVYAHFAFLTAFGSNQDYTVSTAGTVNGGRGSVFQDSHVLNV